MALPCNDRYRTADTRYPRFSRSVLDFHFTITVRNLPSAAKSASATLLSHLLATTLLSLPPAAVLKVFLTRQRHDGHRTSIDLTHNHAFLASSQVIHHSWHVSSLWSTRMPLCVFSGIKSDPNRSNSVCTLIRPTTVPYRQRSRA